MIFSRSCNVIRLRGRGLVGLLYSYAERFLGGYTTDTCTHASGHLNSLTKYSHVIHQVAEQSSFDRRGVDYIRVRVKREMGCGRLKAGPRNAHPLSLSYLVDPFRTVPTSLPSASW